MDIQEYNKLHEKDKLEKVLSDTSEVISNDEIDLADSENYRCISDILES